MSVQMRPSIFRSGLRLTGFLFSRRSTSMTALVMQKTLIGLLFMAAALVWLDPVLLFFGASAETLPYARDYMEIILAGNVITHVYMGLNEVLRASGYPQKAMAATLMAVVVNCVLDALFIFGFGWGIRAFLLGFSSREEFPPEEAYGTKTERAYRKSIRPP